MDFAINYSPQAAELLAAGNIEFDFFKTPPWPEMIAKAERFRPVAVHFDLRAGGGNLDQINWSEINDIFDATATRFLNIHLAADLRDGLEFDADTPNQSEYNQIVDNMRQDVGAAVTQFSAEKVIVENAPYRAGEGHTIRTCVLPEVICEIVETHGCGLLLDISHARIAADGLQMDPKEYIQALPLQNLKELHFTGLHFYEGRLMDHLPVLEDDWPWLEWVLEGIDKTGWGQPLMLAFEYGGEGHEFFDANSDSTVIARDVPRLYDLCHRKN